jgi:peptidoglycan-associated lipoprotein
MVFSCLVAEMSGNILYTRRDEMSKRAWLSVVMVGMAMFMVCGCAGKKKVDPELGGPTDIEIGHPLSDVDFEATMTKMDVKFTPVYFAYDSFRVEGVENAKIEQIAQFMKSNSRVRLVCEGHCDERGTKEYNDVLGQNRALAIRGYLIHLGISPEHIQAKSYGEERPVDPGHTEAAWRQNRRVEFALYN